MLAVILKFATCKSKKIFKTYQIFHDCSNLFVCRHRGDVEPVGYGPQHNTQWGSTLHSGSTLLQRAPASLQAFPAPTSHMPMQPCSAHISVRTQTQADFAALQTHP